MDYATIRDCFTVYLKYIEKNENFVDMRSVESISRELHCSYMQFLIKNNSISTKMIVDKVYNNLSSMINTYVANNYGEIIKYKNKIDMLEKELLDIKNNMPSDKPKKKFVRPNIKQCDIRDTGLPARTPINMSRQEPNVEPTVASPRIVSMQQPIVEPTVRAPINMSRQEPTVEPSVRPPRIVSMQQPIVEPTVRIQSNMSSIESATEMTFDDWLYGTHFNDLPTTAQNMPSPPAPPRRNAVSTEASGRIPADQLMYPTFSNQAYPIDEQPIHNGDIIFGSIDSSSTRSFINQNSDSTIRLPSIRHSRGERLPHVGDMYCPGTTEVTWHDDNNVSNGDMDSLIQSTLRQLQDSSNNNTKNTEDQTEPESSDDDTDDYIYPSRSPIINRIGYMQPIAKPSSNTGRHYESSSSFYDEIGPYSTPKTFARMQYPQQTVLGVPYSNSTPKTVARGHCSCPVPKTFKNAQETDQNDDRDDSEDEDDLVQIDVPDIPVRNNADMQVNILKNVLDNASDNDIDNVVEVVKNLLHDMKTEPNLNNFDDMMRICQRICLEKNISLPFIVNNLEPQTRK